MIHLIWHLMHILQSLSKNQQKCARYHHHGTVHKPFQQCENASIDISINICPKRHISKITDFLMVLILILFLFALPYNWSP